MKFTKCTVIPKLKFTKCTGIPKLMSINNCNLPRWRIPKMKFSPNWNQYQMMSTQRWEFFTVGQFQFGKISKWMNLNLVENQFGSFTMGVNLKKVNRYLEFVTERDFDECGSWSQTTMRADVTSCLLWFPVSICRSLGKVDHPIPSHHKRLKVILTTGTKFLGSIHPIETR